MRKSVWRVEYRAEGHGCATRLETRPIPDLSKFTVAGATTCKNGWWYPLAKCKGKNGLAAAGSQVFICGKDRERGYRLDLFSKWLAITNPASVKRAIAAGARVPGCDIPSAASNFRSSREKASINPMEAPTMMPTEIIKNRGPIIRFHFNASVQQKVPLG